MATCRLAAADRGVAAAGDRGQEAARVVIYRYLSFYLSLKKSKKNCR